MDEGALVLIGVGGRERRGGCVITVVFDGGEGREREKRE